MTDDIEKCPVCDEPLKEDDTCATDIELGICHAACLEGSPVVDLDTGEPVDGEVDTYRYGEPGEPPICGSRSAIEDAGLASETAWRTGFVDGEKEAGENLRHSQEYARGLEKNLENIRALGQQFMQALQKIASEDDAGTAQLIACEALTSAPPPISPVLAGDAMLNIAKFAGQHDIRYPTNAAMQAFIGGILADYHAEWEKHQDPAILGIEDVMKESGGAWRPCSGCYDTEDGHPTQRYPFSKALGCDVGCGCHECGGLGATWEHWTEEDLASWEKICEEADAEHDLEAENNRFRHAMQDAIDMLLERKQGNPARSSAHNARICLQFALTGDVVSPATEGKSNV